MILPTLGFYQAPTLHSETCGKTGLQRNLWASESNTEAKTDTVWFVIAHYPYRGGLVYITPRGRNKGLVSNSYGLRNAFLVAPRAQELLAQASFQSSARENSR